MLVRISSCIRDGYIWTQQKMCLAFRKVKLLQIFNCKYLYFKAMVFVLLKGKKLQLQYLITKLTYSLRNRVLLLLGVFATVKGWHFVIVVLQNNVSTFLAFKISMYIEGSGRYSRAQVFWERCYKCQIRQYGCLRYMISQSM